MALNITGRVVVFDYGEVISLSPNEQDRAVLLATADADPELFWHIHRSTLVNTQAIAGVSRDFRGRQLVAVKGSTEKLEVSRSYSQLFKGM